MSTAELIIHLPVSDIEFLKQYAKSHGSTVSELIEQYIQSLQASQQAPLHPDIQKITGILPSDIDAQAVYYQHVLKKHQ